MLFQNKLELYLRDVRDLERSFLDAQNKEILPMSFFSNSIDILNRLKTGIYEVEVAQLRLMQEHLKRQNSEWFEANEPNEFETSDEIKELEEEEEADDEDDDADEFEEEEMDEPEQEEAEKLVELKISKEEIIPPTSVMTNSTGRKITTDLGKLLSLNDRFMFLRDIFKGNAKEMNQVFTRLNAFQSLSEALEFLNRNYAIPWDSDAGIAFKELLEKRFA